jgi:hypothetical protein
MKDEGEAERRKIEGRGEKGEGRKPSFILHPSSFILLPAPVY